jgi:hypothetical protein
VTWRNGTRLLGTRRPAQSPHDTGTLKKHVALFIVIKARLKFYHKTCVCIKEPDREKSINKGIACLEWVFLLFGFFFYQNDTQRKNDDFLVSWVRKGWPRCRGREE